LAVEQVGVEAGARAVDGQQFRPKARRLMTIKFSRFLRLHRQYSRWENPARRPFRPAGTNDRVRLHPSIDENVHGAPQKTGSATLGASRLAKTAIRTGLVFAADAGRLRSTSQSPLLDRPNGTVVD
jgi:hypothetical protein